MKNDTLEEEVLEEEDRLDDDLEEEYEEELEEEEEDYEEGVADDDFLEEGEEEEIITYYIEPDFQPEPEELSHIVDTWNERNERIISNWENAGVVLDRKKLIKMSKKRTRRFRKLRNAGKIVTLLGILYFAAKYGLFRDYDLPLYIGILICVLGLAMYFVGRIMRKRQRRITKEMTKTLSEEKKVFYEEQKVIFTLQSEAKEYFKLNGIESRRRSVPEVLRILMGRCGLDLPVVELPLPNYALAKLQQQQLMEQQLMEQQLMEQPLAEQV